MNEEDLLLPKFGCHLDESDPDVVVLRRQNGAFVAAFSAAGATREGIAEAAREDRAAPHREDASLRPPPRGPLRAPDLRRRPVHPIA